jgi:mono/diheme cytochrome c family protein
MQGGGRTGRGTAEGGPGQFDPINAGIDWSRKPSVLPKRPDEQLQHFVLQPGYRLELVLSEPDIQDPAAIAFDGNGRMFVLELRGYMQDVDATGQLDPVGRISMHVDANNDGRYEQHSVFVDKLIFPRFVMPFGPNAILTKESNADEVWKFTDTNGDGVADKKELFDTGYGRTANVEHQESFLFTALDNWMYSSVNAFRARWTPQGVIKEPTGANGSQWGVTQDDDGKLWFQGGASGLPSYWQFPIVYGNVSAPDQLEKDFGIPWGAPIRIADMQGGMYVTRMPDGSLTSTTAGAGNDVFRGHRLPPDLVGDYLYGEVVARIVRRVRPEKREGLTTVRNAYLWNEFIKSTDPYFRPVDITTAPDGTVYITDMYHGIIQESQWSGPGTYLRARIQQYDLDKVIHRGRIWRLVYDGVKRDKSDALDRDTRVPHMNDETAAQLVAHLSHPNGWWRDTAQQLLVLKQDKSVTAMLASLASSSPNLLARAHALWTLEGLGALDADLVRQLMADKEPRLRIQAIRASETLYKSGDHSFAADYRKLASDQNIDVVLQSLLTLNRWKVPGASDTIAAARERHKARGVQLVAETLLNPPAAIGRGGRGSGAVGFTPDETRRLERGEQIYRELCSACHGDNALGAPKPGMSGTMAPPLAGSPRINGHRDYVIRVLLHGLTGSIDDKSYGDLMMPMRDNSDEWVAAVASYVRTGFGNSSGPIAPADVARVRTATADRKSPFTVVEALASLPVRLIADGWKATASHNAATATAALSFVGWNSGTPLQSGMWFQIELPAELMVSEIQFTSTTAAGRGGGGGRSGAESPATPSAPAATQGRPREYTVQVSNDGATWRPVVGRAEGGGTTTIAFAPVRAKFIRLTQVAAVENAASWSIQNLRLFGPAAQRQ